MTVPRLDETARLCACACGLELVVVVRRDVAGKSVAAAGSGNSYLTAKMLGEDAIKLVSVARELCEVMAAETGNDAAAIFAATVNAVLSGDGGPSETRYFRERT